MAARNDLELSRMLIPAIEKAIDYVVQKIWNDNRELIEQIVYQAQGQGYSGANSAYTSNPVLDKSYVRTGEFKQAWDTDVKSGYSNVRGTFKYAPEKMSVGANGQHSSVYGGEDFREYLAETIYQGLSGDFGYGINSGTKRYAKTNPMFANEYWAKKRDVWTALKRKIGINTLRKYFEEGMALSGLNFNRRKASIQRREYDEK